MDRITNRLIAILTWITDHQPWVGLVAWIGFIALLAVGH